MGFILAHRIISWLAIVILVFLAAAAAAYSSYEGSPVRQWLEEKAEEAKDLNAPEMTGLAPWLLANLPEDYVLPKLDQEQRLPVNNIPLEEQHRSADEIAEWLMVVVAESLAFDTQNYEQVTRQVTRYFLPFAYDQYLEFLKQGNIEQTLQENDLRLYSFVQEKPYLLNKGSLDGSYRWLFEV